ncbi:MAG TPA: bifunctional phosphoribosylaminoimidazolecarboxamide formyltransferase/IMP cyclohydrolase [Bacteroidota bacterium]|nr:bifunctional phosphoribosylaminoimidazolecarboxamide formyltransferase/IMP cyclohydrolase [Bacteroidota bacterium]
MTNSNIPIIGKQTEPSGGSLLKIRRALISVSDKRGIIQFATTLKNFNVQIISTGGTYTALKEAGFDVTPVSEVTGFPEILDGRVKTVHPKILGGILGVADNPKHVEQMKEHDIEPIELVVINLYPFEQTIANDDVKLETAIENIDIGGPTMVRAAAKNYLHTAVVVNPSLYGIIAEELQSHDGCITGQTRFQLACSAFQHTAHYDTVIATYLRGLASPTGFPETFTVSMRRTQNLRYGENPHQSASLYGQFNEYFVKLHGKELSYNNILDINNASQLCAEFNEPAVVIVKHGNPCGVASAPKLVDAYRIALATDSKSAFGGIVALNRPLDLPTAEALNELFLEVVVAPDFEPRVVEFLMKKKDRRVMQQKVNLRALRSIDIRSVAGGLLVQDPDEHRISPNQLKVVTKRSPSDDEMAAMLFAWKIVKHVKSNAIVYARGDRTLGIGAGQMSRVDSSMMAALKAKEAGLDLAGCAVASDAYFPFADGMLEAVKVGATAVIEPGGSIRDQDVIKAADEHNVAMVFTGIRHFRH